MIDEISLCMRRKRKEPLGPYYIRAILYAGDLPYLEISLGSTMLFLTSDATRQFQLVTDFDTDISRQQQEDDGIFKSPDWSFMISNGHETLYLHPNAGKSFVKILSSGSEMETLHTLNVADAEAPSAHMAEACKLGTLSKASKCKLKPADMYRMLKFSEPGSA